MPSRRRSRSKNLGTNLADVQRRMRYLERRPVRTKLQRRVVKTAAIAIDAVTPDEVSFGTNIVSDTQPDENYLKAGTTWTLPDTGATSVYDGDTGTFIPVTDAAAMATADGKNTIYAQATEPTGGAYKTDDIWFDTDDGNKLYRWTGTVWVSAQDTAITAAAQAAVAAQSTADGKNTIYRQTTQPTGGTYKAGDTWFDTDADNAIYRYSLGSTGTVSNKALTSNVATLTTTAAHSFTPGESITVSGVDATFDGTYTVVAVPTTTTLTYAKTAANVTSVASGGTITSTAGWKAILLGSSAITSISATQISTGTLAAGVVYAGSINTNQISAGTLAAGVIYGGTINADKINAGTLQVGVIYAGNISAGQITAGTITAAISMTSPTMTSGVFSTNAVTSFSAVSAGAPRATLASQYLSQETSGIGVIMDTGAGTTPGGFNARTNIAGTGSFLSAYAQNHGGGTGVLVLNSGGAGTSGYASIGVSGGANVNSIMVTNTYAQMTVGSTYSLYALRNIKCVSSFTPGSDATGTDGDVVLVYTP